MRFDKNYFRKMKKYRDDLHKFKEKWPEIRQANMYTIDYSPNISDIGETDSTFIAETTFTALDWMILDHSDENPDFDMKDIDHEQLLQICFNIFPECRSILHKIVQSRTTNEKGKKENEDKKEKEDKKDKKDNEDEQDQQEIFTDDQAVKGLFAHARNGFPYDNDYIAKFEPLEIPVFEDMMGNTAIDDALGIVEGRKLTDVMKKCMRKMREIC